MFVACHLGIQGNQGISGTGTHNDPHIKNGDDDPAIRSVTEIIEEKNKRKTVPGMFPFALTDGALEPQLTSCFQKKALAERSVFSILSFGP